MTVVYSVCVYSTNHHYGTINSFMAYEYFGLDVASTSIDLLMNLTSNYYCIIIRVAQPTEHEYSF